MDLDRDDHRRRIYACVLLSESKSNGKPLWNLKSLIIGIYEYRLTHSLSFFISNLIVSSNENIYVYWFIYSGVYIFAVFRSNADDARWPTRTFGIGGRPNPRHCRRSVTPLR